MIRILTLHIRAPASIRDGARFYSSRHTLNKIDLGTLEAIPTARKRINPDESGQFVRSCCER